MNIDNPVTPPPAGRKVGNLATFFCLYIAQTIPMSFFSTVIPVMMRQQNFSLAEIGLLQLIKLPWILKFLWSPLVDRHARTLGDYKRWIFTGELVYAAIIFCVAFLDFKLHFHIILVMIIAAFIASATQDIATDALAILSFDRKDKSLANSMQAMGSFGGALVGSGLLLMLFKSMGWNSLLPCVAVFVVVAVLPLMFNRKLQIMPRQVHEKANVADVLKFFTRRGIWRQIVFLFFYYAGMIGILAMMRPFLVDLGYDMKQIGLISGIAGTAIGCLSSFAGGFIVRRIGRYYARRLFAAFIVASTLYFVAMSYLSAITLVNIYVGVFLIWGSYGMATIIVYTTAMDHVRPGREGTDFTIQTVITHLSGMLMAVLCGYVADKMGYHGLFITESAIAIFSFIYVWFVFKRE